MSRVRYFTFTVFFLLLANIFSFATKIEADSIYQHALTFQNQGKLDLAKTYYSQALDHYSTIKQDPEIFKTISHIYNNLGNIHYDKSQLDTAKIYHRKALSIRNNIKDSLGIADSYNNLGTANISLGYYDSAIYYLLSAKERYIQLNHTQRLGMVYNNIGYTYHLQGNYAAALPPLYKALEVREKIGDNNGIGDVYNNIGKVHSEERTYDEAIDSYKKALEYYQINDYQAGIANVYTNIGNVYFQNSEQKEALTYFNKSLIINKRLRRLPYTAMCKNNIGLIYYNQNNFQQALEHHLSALVIRKQIADQAGIAQSYTNLGHTAIALRRYNEANEYLQEALNISKEINSKKNIQYSYLFLSQLESAQQNYKAAYDAHIQYTNYKDTLLNEENIQKATQAKMNYEFDKQKALMMVERAKRETIYQSKVRRRQIIIYFSIGILILSIAFLIWTYKQFIEKKKINNQLDLKNREITDSINYTLRIQRALMKKQEEIYAKVPDSFIYYLPKDIVSGDFYFFNEKINSFYIAAADCTGHGIPGAFMSVLSLEKLNDALNVYDLPGDILMYVNKAIKKSLRQSNDIDTTRDGMDIALCKLNSQSGVLEYSGANRPLWIIRKYSNDIEEIKATKKGIAGHTEIDQFFETHIIQLNPGDTFYISSDGYADQFGGEKGKKLMTKNFKQYLLSIQNESMQQQKILIEKFYIDWKQGYEQIDDVLVIGIRY